MAVLLVFAAMSEHDRLKWDERYRQGAYQSRTHPSAYLVEQMPPLGYEPRAGQPLRALDIACGAGRNAIYLASLGFVVDAVDISAAGLAVGQQRAAMSPLAESAINWLCQDVLEPAGAAEQLFPQTLYNLIIMIRFAAPRLLPSLLKRLAAGGHLLVESHLQWSAASTGLAGPEGQRFRVAPGALLAAVANADNVQIIHQQEGLVVEPDGSKAAVSRLLVRAGK